MTNKKWEDTKKAIREKAQVKGASVKYKGVNSTRDKAFMQNYAYRQKELEGYDIDHTLSNQKGTVYVNKATGKATLAFAGTQVEKKHWRQGAKDVWADVHIGLGQESSSEEFKKAERQYLAVTSKYGKENVDLTGHSLGGTKAAWISHKHGAQADVYNMGISPSGREQWDLRNVTDHTTPGDVIAEGAGSLQNTGLSIDKNTKQTVSVLKGLIPNPKKMLKQQLEKEGFKETGAALAESESVLTAGIGETMGMVATAATEVAPYLAVGAAVVKAAPELHASTQFVPKGRTDAANLLDKPPDSKPILPPTPAPTPSPAPTPFPAPKPFPAPAPPPTPSSAPTQSRYHHMHVGAGGF